MEIDMKGNFIFKKKHVARALMVCSMIPDFIKNEVLESGEKLLKKLLQKRKLQD